MYFLWRESQLPTNITWKSDDIQAVERQKDCPNTFQQLFKRSVDI